MKEKGRKMDKKKEGKKMEIKMENCRGFNRDKEYCKDFFHSQPKID